MEWNTTKMNLKKSLQDTGPNIFFSICFEKVLNRPFYIYLYFITSVVLHYPIKTMYISTVFNIATGLDGHV